MRYLLQWHCSFSTSGHKNCMKKQLFVHCLQGTIFSNHPGGFPGIYFCFVRMNTFVYYHSALLAHFPHEDTKIAEELRGAPRESPHNWDFEETVNLIVRWTVFYHVYTKINFPEPMPHENKFPDRAHAEKKLSVQTKFYSPPPPFRIK